MYINSLFPIVYLHRTFAFFIAIAVIVIKAISSVGLYEPDYSSLSVQQQNYYLDCMDKFGGKLNDEKEAATMGTGDSFPFGAHGSLGTLTNEKPPRVGSFFVFLQSFEVGAAGRGGLYYLVFFGLAVLFE